jgi:hypothetical protein
MTVHYVDIDPQGILIPQRLGMEEDVSLWHIVDAEQAVTWCGMFLTQGSERRLWSETPQDRRCETCIGRFGGEVVRSPAPAS